MQNYLSKIALSFAIGSFAFLASPAIDRHAGASLIAAAHAEEGHSSGHGSSHQGKGPKYKGGRSGEGHGGADSGHKGNSSHGGGSKTLEDTVFHSEGGHASGDAGHQGGSSGKGGKKFMGGGKGGHEEDEGGDTHEHSEPQ